MGQSEWEMDEKIKRLVDALLAQKGDVSLALNAGIMAAFALCFGFMSVITAYRDPLERTEATRAFIMSMKETPLDPAIIEALESLVISMCNDMTIFQISKKSYPEDSNK